jgi:hypoxanthine phosphoribosyltransferase
MEIVKKCIIIALLIVLPAVVGAILGHYMKIAWLILLFIIAGVSLAGLYLYFNVRFVHIDVDIHSLEKQITELKENIGTGFGNRLSWVEFWSKVQELISKIEGSGFEPDLVLSIGRSGSVVGGMIATNLKAKRHIAIDRTVRILRQPDGTDRTYIDIDKTVIPNKEAFKNKKVLVVMSECETGLTLSEFYDYLQKEMHNLEIRTAVIFKRDNVHFFPHYYVMSTDDQWPELPFRIDGKWLAHHPQDISLSHNIMDIPDNVGLSNKSLERGDVQHRA